MRAFLVQYRLYGLALACGIVAEIGLAAAVYVRDAPGLLPSALLLLEAVLLGLVFPPRPAMVGAATPPLLLFAAEMIRRGSGGGTEDSAVAVLVAVLFVAMLLAFGAGMTAAVRERYFTRRASG